MFSPLVAGVVTCLVLGVSVREVGLRLGRPWWVVLAGFASLPLVGLTLLIAVLGPGVGFDPAVNPIPGIALPAGAVGVLVTLGLVLVLGGTVNAVFAIGEEFGWRGYLLRELAPIGF